MEVRNATYDDVERIVEIHINAFEGFFLTFLGTKFLRLLYVGFINQGVLRVAVVNSNIVGFSAGTEQPDIFFSNLRKNKWLSFFLAAAPGLIKKTVFSYQKALWCGFLQG